MSGPGLRYTVDVDDPARHLVTVQVEIPVEDPAHPVLLTLPVWSPGSYLVRDYARFVRDLAARGDDGVARVARKVDKSTWAIDASRTGTLTVTYRLYGHDLSVRTNHVDASHAFLHGPATFAYVEDLRRRPVALTVRPPAGRLWRLACALPGGELGPPRAEYELTATSVDELLDAPIHLGHGEEVRFTNARVPFELAVWGTRAPGGLYSLDRLAADLTAIGLDHARRIGGDGGPVLPFPRYTFVLMLAHDAYGGLEHRASSANLHNPQCLANRKQYEGLLELLSHELFHAWNGKRIAPTVLLDFDYTREVYTRCLWVMEGLTSHYDRWALRSAKVITARSFFDKVLDDWSRLQAVPGRARHSLEDSSFDAWIKLYRPDESNLNTTVSYYLKGGLAALALDLEIRRRTAGARSLDDAVRALWQRFGATGRGHPEDLEPVFGEAIGLDLGEFFARQVRGTDDPPLAAELAHLGLDLRAGADPAQVADGAAAVWLGATASGARITGVHDGSPAAAAGLAPGDELCALDRLRVGGEGEARSLLAGRRPGDAVELTIFRRGRLETLTATVGAAPPTRYEIVAIAAPSAEQAARYQAWMGEDLPVGQSLAAVTTTTRWL